MTSARSAAEAVGAAVAGRPDVMVSDIGMPGEDGLALMPPVAGARGGGAGGGADGVRRRRRIGRGRCRRGSGRSCPSRSSRRSW